MSEQNPIKPAKHPHRQRPTARAQTASSVTTYIYDEKGMLAQVINPDPESRPPEVILTPGPTDSDPSG